MKALPVWVIVMAMTLGLAGVVDTWGQALSPAGNKNLSFEDEAHFKEATRAVLCPCSTCPPTLLDDCLCGTAREVRDALAAKFVAGTEPGQLVTEFVAQYGEQYLAAPPKEGFNMVIWIFPALAFVGLSIVFWYALQRLVRTREATAPQTTQSASTARVDKYHAEIQRAVSERSSDSR